MRAVYAQNGLKKARARARVRGVYSVGLTKKETVGVTNTSGISYRLKKGERERTEALASYLGINDAKSLFNFLIDETYAFIEEDTGMDLLNEYRVRMRSWEKRRLSVSAGLKIRKKE
jgi:hypothetical protein